MSIAFEIDQDGTIWTPGVDLSARPLLEEVRLEGGKPAFLAIRLPGRHYWSGRGQQGYAPAIICFYRVIEVATWTTVLASPSGQRRGYGLLRAEELMRVPVRRVP